MRSNVVALTFDTVSEEDASSPPDRKISVASPLWKPTGRSITPTRTANSSHQRALQVSEFTASTANASAVVMTHKGMANLDVEDLAVALIGNTSVTLVDLDHNAIGDLGCRAAGRIFARSKYLVTLSLEDNAIHPPGAIGLLSSLQNNTTLKTLLLGTNYLGPIGMTTLAPAIGSSALTELSLRENFLTDKGATPLAAALKSQQTLAALDLSSNYLGKAGASVILANLPRSLTRLNLANNLIGPEVASPLANALAEHPVLTSLCLDENQLGAQGCEHALIAAAKSTVLKSFSMASCGATEISFLACVSHLKKNHTLTTLNLVDNPISAKDTAKYWCTLFQFNRTLGNVKVSDLDLQAAIDEARRG